MSQVERLLAEYIEEHRGGGEADPLAYLARVQGAERLELEALIDGYLAHAPRRPPPPEEYAGSLAEQIVESLAPSLAGVSGLWPTVLPDLRNRARVKRSELVSRLAAALGLAGREDKVADYYNQMEAGRLPAEGVSQKVLAALGQIVGASAEQLRSMGDALTPSAGDAETAVAFTRYAAPGEPASAAPPAAPATAERQEPADWDEVDELFRGGG